MTSVAPQTTMIAVSIAPLPFPTTQRLTSESSHRFANAEMRRDHIQAVVGCGEMPVDRLQPLADADQPAVDEFQMSL